MKVSRYSLPQISELEKNDPLLIFLRKVSKGSLVRVAVISLLINGLFGIGGALVLSTYYSRFGANFISFFDIREWPVVCYTYLIHYPLIWTYYFWQMDGFLATLRKLENTGIIGTPRTQIPKHMFLTRTLVEDFSRPRKRILPVTFLVGFLLFWALIWFQQDFSSIMLFTDKPITWSHINPFYYWLIWMPLNGFFLGYIIGWMFSRSYTTNAYFHRLFRMFEINPIPFHIDRCNGLAPIGRYSKLNAYVIGLDYGLWLAVYIAFPLLFSSTVNLDFVTIPYLLVFFFLASPLLLWPAIAAHLGMKSAKARILDQIGSKLSRIIIKPGKTRNTQVDLEILKTKYTMLEKELHEWPFPSPGFFGFLLSALSATIPTITSLLLEIYIKVV